MFDVKLGKAVFLLQFLRERRSRKPITYREISEQMGVPARTVQRWERKLREEGYIETEMSRLRYVGQIISLRRRV